MKNEYEEKIIYFSFHACKLKYILISKIYLNINNALELTYL